MSDYILVVDDDWMNRELLETYLKMGGYQVQLTNTGENALEIAFDDPPTLVMLDIRLTGMSGFEVCSQLKNDERTHAVPILIVSALESDGDRMQATQLGASGFVAKPFDPHTLLAQIASVLHPE